MNLLKKLVRWWLEGWQVFFYYASFYILLSIFLGGPLYLWEKKVIPNHWSIVLTIIYIGIYVPMIFRTIASYLGRLPNDAKKI